MFGVVGGSLVGRALDGEADVTLYHAEHIRGYGVTDWLSLYGKLGGAYLTTNDPTIKKTDGSSTEHHFGANLLVGVQAKNRFWRSAKYGLEWDGSVQYLDIRARHKGKNEVGWHEWQFSTSVAKSLGRFTPYIGVKASILAMKFHVRQEGQVIRQDTYHDDVPIGAFIGTDYAFGESESVILNIEGAYTSGPEVNVALAYTF